MPNGFQGEVLPNDAPRSPRDERGGNAYVKPAWNPKSAGTIPVIVHTPYNSTFRA